MQDGDLTLFDLERYMFDIELKGRAMERRHFIAVLGGGAILAAGTAAGLIAGRRPRTALMPWQVAGAGHADPRVRALSWAILAPNPHNRQPWQVDLSVPDQAVLHVDTERLLPQTDPFSRQITIGLGCFIELAVMAAAQDGIAVAAEVFPEGSDAAALDRRPVAILRFGGPTQADPLFAHCLERRSNKEPYDTAMPVAQDALDAILAAARHGRATGSVAAQDIAEMRALTHEALAIEIDTPRTYLESVDLFRIGARAVDANPDGIDFTGPMFELLGATGMMGRAALLDPSSVAYRAGRAAVFENTDTAMGHLWLVTEGNARVDQIAAGRDWLRLNLAATRAGVAMQPLSQALQEYPEMEALHGQVHARLAPGGGTVQMLARIGYGSSVSPSPRWPLETKLI